jgi:hypothetical protein
MGALPFFPGLIFSLWFPIESEELVAVEEYRYE